MQLRKEYIINEKENLLEKICIILVLVIPTIVRIIISLKDSFIYARRC